MGASLAVSLANIWKKSFEHQIKSTKEIINKIPKNDLEACPECNRRVTYRGKGVECEKCENWFHAKCQNFDDKLDAKMKDMVWYCSNCQKINKLDCEPETEGQLLLRYVDHIICTVNGEPDTLLREVYNLQRKLEFTMENPDENGNLAFFDVNINQYK